MSDETQDPGNQPVVIDIDAVLNNAAAKVQEALKTLAPSRTPETRTKFEPVVEAARLIPVTDREGKARYANLAIWAKSLFATLQIEKVGENFHPKPQIRRRANTPEMTTALWGGAPGTGVFLGSHLPVHEVVLTNYFYPIIKALSQPGVEEAFRKQGLVYDKALRTEEGTGTGTYLAMPLDRFKDTNFPHTALCIFGVVYAQGGKVTMDHASQSWAIGTEPSRIRFNSNSGNQGRSWLMRGGPGFGSLQAKAALAALVEQSLALENPDSPGETLGQALSKIEGQFSSFDPRVRDQQWANRGMGVESATKAGFMTLEPQAPQVRRRDFNASGTPVQAGAGGDADRSW